MIEGRLAKGPPAYDPGTFLRSLGEEPLGEVAPEGLETLSAGRKPVCRGRSPAAR